MNNKEHECQTIKNAIDSLVTAYEYLIEGPLYVEIDTGIIELHEHGRELDMKNIEDSVIKLHALYISKKCK